VTCGTNARASRRARPSTARTAPRRTNWRSPSAEPDALYSSPFELEVPIVVNGVAYIEEANSESAQGGSRQRMINLADGSVEPSTAEETYGGRVIAGGDQSLTSDIYIARPGSAQRPLGCVEDGANTVHDVLVGPDAVYVSVFYTDFKATILRYPL
jgi:hypothetical protein